MNSQSLCWIGAGAPKPVLVGTDTEPAADDATGVGTAGVGMAAPGAPTPAVISLRMDAAGAWTEHQDK